MNKVLIPTKLSDVAANTLKTAGYEVIQDADTPLEKQVAAIDIVGDRYLAEQQNQINSN